MYYFAYASNLNRKQMLERCPDARPEFPAELPNHRLVFAGWSRRWGGGVAGIKPSQSNRVAGAVYQISERCLAALDRHEGCPGVYEHSNVVVFTDLGQAVQAVTYVKVEQSEETAPSPEYVAVIKQGYKDWGII